MRTISQRPFARYNPPPEEVYDVGQDQSIDNYNFNYLSNSVLPILAAETDCDLNEIITRIEQCLGIEGRFQKMFEGKV